MAAGIYNFTIEQGTTVEKLLIWRDSDDLLVPVDGYTARMQVRTTVIDPVILMELTTEDGNITCGPADGEIHIFIPDNETEAINWATGVYDLELISPAGKVTRLLKGNITIDPEVTR